VNFLYLSIFHIQPLGFNKQLSKQLKCYLAFALHEVGQDFVPYRIQLEDLIEDLKHFNKITRLHHAFQQ